MRIGPPQTDAERIDAFQCLLAARSKASLDEARRAAILADSGSIDLNGLIAVWNGSVALCAGLFTLAADGTAFVWPPEARSACKETPALRGRLLQEIVSRIDAQGIAFAQALVDTDRGDQRLALESAGFRWIAEVVSLQRPLTTRPPALPGKPGSIGYSEEKASRFEALIERTWLGSEDGGALSRCRTAAELLHTYRWQGQFTPERWRIVEEAGVDAAVILVNDHPADSSREILYLGVVPEARRRGFARRLVAEAILDAASDGCASLVTIADAENYAAVSLYESLGFVAGTRKAAFARRTPQGGNRLVRGDDHHEQVVHTG